jgi:hypothetical protein
LLSVPELGLICNEFKIKKQVGLDKKATIRMILDYSTSQVRKTVGRGERGGVAFS